MKHLFCGRRLFEKRAMRILTAQNCAIFADKGDQFSCGTGLTQRTTLSIVALIEELLSFL